MVINIVHKFDRIFSSLFVFLDSVHLDNGCLQKTVKVLFTLLAIGIMEPMVVLFI